jgi:hypothetical protein
MRVLEVEYSECKGRNQNFSKDSQDVEYSVHLFRSVSTFSFEKNHTHNKSTKLSITPPHRDEVAVGDEKQKRTDAQQLRKFPIFE